MKMNFNEAETAMLKQLPVECGGIEYKCIRAIIYRRDGCGRLIIQAELQDKKAHSVSIADMDKIKEAAGNE